MYTTAAMFKAFQLWTLLSCHGGIVFIQFVKFSLCIWKYISAVVLERSIGQAIQTIV